MRVRNESILPSLGEEMEDCKTFIEAGTGSEANEGPEETEGHSGDGLAADGTEAGESVGSFWHR
jgi:hypothetical protein